MRKIAIYGKGGIGKSTTTSNLSAALAEAGYRVMQIGCDPKADSTSGLTGGKAIPTVLNVLKEKGKNILLKDIAFEGENGIICVEAGGPTPGIGCAGRGIITAFDKLEELGAYDYFKPDIVLYDVLGDVVCGGFAMPIRGGYAKEVFVVTSGEKMAIYAAANIALAIENFKNRGYADLAGIILNSRGVENEKKLVEELANDISARVIQVLSRSPYVQQAEEANTTVISGFSASPMAEEYRELARKILEVSRDV